MFYTIYKTTNKLNGKWYIGCHITDILNDDYLGSGTILKNAINKYGKNVFEREFLFFAFDEESMLWAEKELVITKDKDNMSYNIVDGGGKPPVHFGHTFNRGMIRSEETKQKLRLAKLGKKTKPRTEEEKMKISSAQKGRKFTEEHKRKLSASMIGRTAWNKGKVA